MHIPDHLQKSRHGIWYYRWVVPAAVRSRHLGLPRELKRSTHTADIREARVAARRLHQAFLTKLVDGLNMWTASIRMACKTTFILAGWTGMNNDGLQDAVLADVFGEFLEFGLGKFGARIVGVLK